MRNAFGKCDTPANTVDRIKRGFNALGLEVGYEAYRVCDQLHWGRTWIDALQIVCLGKGVTPELARASAYAELAERFSGGLFYPIFEEQVRFHLPALYNTTTDRFLNFAWLPGYAQSHPDRVPNAVRVEDLLARETHLTSAQMADIKGSRMASHWVDGYSLLRDETVKVPINLVAYIHGSNGLAAGNTIEEAIIQATCEIFERHATIQTVGPERIAPTIAADAIDIPLIQKLIGFYREKNVDVMVKDLSFDGLLPVIGVLFVNRNLKSDRLEFRILNAGASFQLEEGLTRCLTEGMQGRTTLAAPRPELDRPVVPRSRVNNLYLLMRCGISLKDISFLEQGETRPYPATTRIHDLHGELEALKAICRRLETDCIIVDHTHPVLQFPVARVIIPRISDFLPFLGKEILVADQTKPSAAWRGEAFKAAMESFFGDRRISSQ
ncbi:MAG: YcaO-like family protein [Desulfobacteraceae bacterium]|nr:YcaO-like family protein [Desulfobacteraceae bacterium]